ncbi:hypothetical protein C0992_008751, partial [Termitomyces sp. T32_za158]
MEEQRQRVRYRRLLRHRRTWPSFLARHAEYRLTPHLEARGVAALLRKTADRDEVEAAPHLQVEQVP